MTQEENEGSSCTVHVADSALRDVVAMEVLKVALQNPGFRTDLADAIAKSAYTVADAMMKARNG